MKIELMKKFIIQYFCSNVHQFEINNILAHKVHKFGCFRASLVHRRFGIGDCVFVAIETTTALGSL